MSASRPAGPVPGGLQMSGSTQPLRSVAPVSRMPERIMTTHEIGELDIPTFIRRQMD